MGRLWEALQWQHAVLRHLIDGVAAARRTAVTSELASLIDTAFSCPPMGCVNCGN